MSSEELLLDEVKNRLNITWNYDDEELILIIGEAKEFIILRVGEVDFLTDISAKRLLKEYCRYAWDGALSVFESNFRSDILNLQLKNATKI